MNKTERALHLGKGEMRGFDRTNGRDGRRRVLFIQATNPGAYPPLIHASALMAEGGWDVTFLSAPIAGDALALAPHPRIKIHTIRTRTSHVMNRISYALYAAEAARLALLLRPNIVYASDPLGAGPGLLAARLSGAGLVYHEHDSPSLGMLRPILARARASAARAARLVVFPNADRAHVAQSELRFSDNQLRIVWNVPRRAELASSTAPPEPPLIVYYHGSITPERLPETVARAVRRMAGRVLLRIAGYEAPGARGYIRRLVDSGSDTGVNKLVEYTGMIPRADLLTQAERAHVGLALVPSQSNDLNMRYMTGASNKSFDYMAAGLALLVSDLPDWKTMFVDPGFALTCDPNDTDSISTALAWFVDHRDERRVMADRARKKIKEEWNYDEQFRPILESL